MKNNIFLAALSAMCVFAACVKETPDQMGLGHKSPIVKTIELKASFADEPQAKAGLGEMADGRIPFIWNDGDQLKALLDGKALANLVTVTPDQNDPSKATLTISFTEEEVPTEESGDIVLFFPGGTVQTTMAEAGFPFTVPTVQCPGEDGMPYDFYGRQMLPCVANAGAALDVYEERASGVCFKNPFALISFELDKSLSDVVSFKLKGDGTSEVFSGAHYVASDGKVTLNEEWVNNYRQYEYHVTLYGSASTTEPSVFEAGQKYYLLAPAVTCNGGFTVELALSDGTVLTKSSPRQKIDFEASMVNDLGILRSLDFPREWQIIYGASTIPAGVPMRLAAYGDVLYVSNGSAVYAVDRVDGEVMGQVTTPSGYAIHSLVSDHAGNMLIAGTCANGKNESFDIYAMTSMDATPVNIYHKDDNDVYGTTYGNVRVFGDINSKAVVTYFAGGAYNYYQTLQIVNGQKTEEKRGQITSISGNIWSVNNGCVAPLGDDLSDGIAAVGYSAPYKIHYTTDYQSWTMSDDLSTNGYSNFPCLSSIEYKGKTYIAYVSGAHGWIDAGAEVVVIDVADKSVVWRKTIPMGSYQDGNEASSDVLLSEVAGSLWVYATDAKFGKIIAAKVEL